MEAMRRGRFYAKRTKLGPTIGRRCVDGPAPSNGWVIYWYVGRQNRWTPRWWPLHVGRVFAKRTA